MTLTHSSGRYQLVLDNIHTRRYLNELLPEITLPIPPKITGGGHGLEIRMPTEGTRYRLVRSGDGEAWYESEK